MLRRLINKYWYIFGLWACRMFCVVFFRMHIYGQKNVPRKGGFLLVSNHQSFLDPIFCSVPLRRQLVYVGRDTLFRSWIFRNIIASVGAIAIRRGQADISAVRQILAKLKEGFGLCLFPEATRTADGTIASLRPGFGLLSRRSGVPIVPMVIDGAFECWPRHKKLFAPGHHISIMYGESISLDDLKDMSDEELAVQLTGKLRCMLNEIRSRRGKNAYEYSRQSGEED